MAEEEDSAAREVVYLRSPAGLRSINMTVSHPWGSKTRGGMQCPEVSAGVHNVRAEALRQALCPALERALGQDAQELCELGP